VTDAQGDSRVQFNIAADFLSIWRSNIIWKSVQLHSMIDIKRSAMYTSIPQRKHILQNNNGLANLDIHLHLTSLHFKAVFLWIYIPSQGRNHVEAQSNRPGLLKLMTPTRYLLHLATSPFDTKSYTKFVLYSFSNKN
jgi:hypothetical protein